MRRGDLVTVALPGDFGKPRPALVIQSDLFVDTPTVTVLPVTSELRNIPSFRLAIQPTSANGLRRVSQIMVDKAHTVLREKIGSVIGRLEDEMILEVNTAMVVFYGLT